MTNSLFKIRVDGVQLKCPVFLTYMLLIIWYFSYKNGTFMSGFMSDVLSSQDSLEQAYKLQQLKRFGIGFASDDFDKYG